MPAVPPKPLPKPLPKVMPKPLARPLPEPMAKPLAKPTPEAVAGPLPEPVAKSAPEIAPGTMQACFLIGPPGAPQDMKDLYERAGLQLKNGDDSLSKKLFEVRINTVKYITLPDGKKKPMLQRVLEERLGKELQKVETTVGQSFVRGDIIPNLVIYLEKTLYTDGSPIGFDLSVEIAKALESVFGVIFKAQWVQSSVR